MPLAIAVRSGASSNAHRIPQLWLHALAACIGTDRFNQLCGLQAPEADQQNIPVAFRTGGEARNVRQNTGHHCIHKLSLQPPLTEQVATGGQSQEQAVMILSPPGMELCSPVLLKCMSTLSRGCVCGRVHDAGGSTRATGVVTAASVEAQCTVTRMCEWQTALLKLNSSPCKFTDWTTPRGAESYVKQFCVLNEFIALYKSFSHYS